MARLADSRHAWRSSPRRLAGFSRLLRSAALLGLLTGSGAVAAEDPTQLRAQAREEIGPMRPTSSGYLSVEGGRLYHEVFGEGYPLVFLHDGLAHSEVWDAQVAAFAPDYRVVRYDRRGYGRSDAPQAPFSDLEDLDALLRELGIEHAVLVGSSAGAELAVDYALAHPERVEALALSGPVVGGLGYSLHFMKRAYDNYAGDPGGVAARWSEDRYAVAPGNETARARLRELLTACPQNLDLARGRFALEPHRPALSRLGEIRVPVLLLVGDRDIPDVLAHAGAIEAAIPGARRVVAADAGHLPCLEQPEAFDSELAEFLSLIGLGPASPLVQVHPATPWAGFRRGFVPVDGSALYYEVMGSGEPVVLLHGGAIDHRMWDECFAALAERHRVVRYDIRGHGLSRSPGGLYCNFRDLEALLDSLGIRRAHLIGLSLGCRVAVDLAIARPERVASLVLASPGVSGCSFDAPEERAYMERIGAAWMAGDFAQAAEEFVRAWCDGPTRNPEQTPGAVRERIKRMALVTVRPDRELGRGAELDPPAINRLAEIGVPTLAILGEIDMPGIHTIVERVGEQVPGARIERIPRAAHMVNLERPELFQRLVNDFLASHPMNSGTEGSD